MKKSLSIGLAIVSCACLTLTACSSGYEGYSPMGSGWLCTEEFEGGNYEYDSVVEQGFYNVSENPSSYFSLDRNTASYSLVRRQIEEKNKIYPDSVRVEEMINYFDYSFPAPEEKAVGVTGYLADCPWNSKNKLMLAGVKTSEYAVDSTNANYVLLIDVSGSMAGDDRLELAKYGLNKLVDELGEMDVVSIVTYASGVKTVLDGGECTASGKAQIKSAINGLRAYGATNGGDGLDRAYNIAKSHYITGGNNRVIIISDGDFNVGNTSKEYMKEFVQEQAKSGVYLSVLGVGMHNTRDDMLETLALNGNGNYAYLDNKTEAEKVLVHELAGTLKTVAKDAKAGVTFTSGVEKYRLVGYDAKIISEDDFNDDNADTGEIGSNLCVAALYEVKLANNAEGKLADIEVRFKDVREGESADSVSCEITTLTPSSDDLSFISCVAEFGLILRNSKYKHAANISNVLTRLGALSGYISGDSYKKEFVTLVGKASESGYYDQVDYPTDDDLTPIDFGFDFEFLAEYNRLDLTGYKALGGFGCSVYYNPKYEESGVVLQYTMSGAPDVLDTWRLTNIYCTDPEVKFFGGLTLADEVGIKDYIKYNAGFSVELKTNGFTAKNGRITVSYAKGESISINYESTNNQNVDF